MGTHTRTGTLCKYNNCTRVRFSVFLTRNTNTLSWARRNKKKKETLVNST